MVRAGLLCLLLAASVGAEDPFVPLQMDGNSAILDRNSARRDWVKVTNQRMEMTGKTLRVALEDGGATAVILVKGVEKPRHARPILTGKGEYAQLFQSVKALGFTRLVARNPDTLKQWAARLEQGKPILED
jgi:hypothetical protein